MPCISFSGKSVWGELGQLFPCSAGLSITAFFPLHLLCNPSLRYTPSPLLQSPYIPSLCPITLMLMALAIAPSVSTLSKCQGRQLEETMVLGDTTCVYAYQSNLCLPFRLTYDYSVSPVVGSIVLERVLSLIPPLRIPSSCHLQPYHLSRRHPPNHQPPCQALGNSF